MSASVAQITSFAGTYGPSRAAALLVLTRYSVKLEVRTNTAFEALDDASVRAAHLEPITDVSATVSRLAAAHERRTEERARVLALPHGFQAIPQLVPRAG